MTRTEADQHFMNFYSAERRNGVSPDLAWDRATEFLRRMGCPFANDNKSIGDWNTDCAAVAHELLEA